MTSPAEHRPAASLPASRETDLLIASEVMGWPRCSAGTMPRPYIADFHNGSFNIYTPRSNYWTPSTDITAAWDVFERMKGLGWQMYVFTGIHTGEHHRPFDVTFQRHGDGDARASAQTFPLAICRAALAAVKLEARS